MVKTLPLYSRNVMILCPGSIGLEVSIKESLTASRECVSSFVP